MLPILLTTFACNNQVKNRSTDDYFRLAEKGDTAAQFELAMMYLEGNGVAQDDQKAVEWFQKVLNRGRFLRSLRSLFPEQGTVPPEQGTVPAFTFCF